MFKLTNKIPHPRYGKGVSREQYPWKQMKPGDSFFCPRVSKKQTTVPAAHAQNQAHPRKKFSVRKVVENGVQGFRVWRVK